MSDSYIQLNTNVTNGSKTDTEQLSIGGNIVERARTVIAGTGLNEFAGIKNVTTLSGMGVVTRNIPQGIQYVNISGSELLPVSINGASGNLSVAVNTFVPTVTVTGGNGNTPVPVNLAGASGLVGVNVVSFAPTISVNSHAVTNAGTFVTQENGAALTSLQLIDDIVKTEDSASADGHAGVGALAVRKATPANTSGSDGDYEFLQMSAGRLWCSSTIDTALPAGTNAIGKLAANTGVTIGAVEIASSQTLSTVTTVGTVSLASDVRQSTSSNLKAQVEGIAGGANINVNLASASGLIGVTGNLTSTPGSGLQSVVQYTPVMASGGLTAVNQAVMVSGVDKVGQVYVTTTMSSAGTTNYAFELSDNGVNWIQTVGMRIGSWQMEGPVVGLTNDIYGHVVQVPGSRIFRVRCTSITGGTAYVQVSPSTFPSTNWVQGLSTHGNTYVGSPVYIGGQARTTNPTSVSDATAVRAIYDKSGKQVVVPAIRELVVKNNITLTNTSETTLLAAGAAGVYHDITHLTMSNCGPDSRVDIRDATGGTVLQSFYLAASGGGAVLSLNTPMIQTTAANNWTAQASAASDIRISVQAVKNL